MMIRFCSILLAALLAVSGTAAAQETLSPAPSASPSPSPTPVPQPLSATPASAQSNVGLPVSITIANAVLPLTAALSQKVAGVSVAANVVTLQPVRNGTDVLHVVDANSTALDIPVKIAPNAGTVAPALTVRITGGPVDPAYASQQVTLALNRATLALPGATIQMPAIAPVTLPPGGTTTIPVPVTIAGGDRYLDVAGTTQVNVSNVAAAPFDPVLLYYSDDPERITADGVLFRGTVTSGQPVRLYDYHENGPQQRRLVVVLSSESTAPSSVQVVESFAGPNADVMTVGHVVTRNYLTNKPKNQGLIFDIAGNAPLYERDLLAGNREGVAASSDFNVISGGPVTITVMAVSPGVNPATLLNSPLLPGDGKLRKGTFSLANYGTVGLNYVAGGADASTSIGDREPTVPAVAPDVTGRDWGDYGVLFTLNFALNNPTDSPQTVYFYESPRGGPARAAYLVDGVLNELGCATSARSATEVPHRYQIGPPIILPAHAAQTHTLRTMTDGGSNLPIEVGVTATAPQAATPPISAPDGCFPKPVTF